jgi:hypothetical protein
LGCFEQANGDDIKRAMNALDRTKRVTIDASPNLRKSLISDPAISNDGVPVPQIVDIRPQNAANHMAAKLQLAPKVEVTFWAAA